jgi:methylenetetrahydrofolate reductase (NADPH)
VKIDNILKNREKGISFEFFPPKTESGMGHFKEVVHGLSQYAPLYVSVTYGAGGTTQDSTRETLLMLKEETDLTIMSHLTCIGATRDSMDRLLRDYMAHDIRNILALRGDVPQEIADFDPTKGHFRYAKDLVEFVKSFNHFSIAVAVYPEVHQESPSLEADMDYTKRKIDAGAEFAITQMFFDNRYFYDFRDRAVRSGITIPVLPGIIPMTDFEKIKKFALFCKTAIPPWIENKMSRVLDKPEEMHRLAVDIAIRQCEDLLSNGVDYLHFYTLNKYEAVSEIVDALRDRFA